MKTLAIEKIESPEIIKIPEGLKDQATQAIFSGMLKIASATKDNIDTQGRHVESAIAVGFTLTDFDPVTTPQVGNVLTSQLILGKYNEVPGFEAVKDLQLNGAITLARMHTHPQVSTLNSRQDVEVFRNSGEPTEIFSKFGMSSVFLKQEFVRPLYITVLPKFQNGILTWINIAIIAQTQEQINLKALLETVNEKNSLGGKSSRLLQAIGTDVVTAIADDGFDYRTYNLVIVDGKFETANNADVPSEFKQANGFIRDHLPNNFIVIGRTDDSTPSA